MKQSPENRNRLRKRHKKKRKSLNRENRKKMIIIFLILIVMILIIIARLIMINVLNSDQYTRIVLAQMDYDSTIIPFKRGDIKDCNGTVLATSEKVYNLVLDPYVVLNSNGDCEDPTAEAIEKYFDVDEYEVKEQIDENPEGRYIVLKKSLDYDTVKKFQDYMASEDNKDETKYIKGIWFEEEYLRKYPYESLASTLVGFTNKGNVGTWGIEGYYNDELNGTDGRVYGYLSDSSDFQRATVEPVNGYNVISTVDLNIQRIVENHMQELLAEKNCKNMGIVVADPNTGAILAMADAPGYDLNNPRDLSGLYTEEQLEAMDTQEMSDILNGIWRNFCISDTYEAGSTVKPLTIGSALDEGKVTTASSFMCDGGEELFDGYEMQHIACHHRIGHGTTSLMEAIMWSCNDALMQVGHQIGVSDMIRYQRMFGFGQKTGIDLPGEASAEQLVFNEETMGEFELSTSAFGQGYNLTMVQMIAAFSSIVNGGSYYQPHIVKEIVTDNGNTVKSFDKVLVRNTFSEETCDWLKQAMYMTVNDTGEFTTGSAAKSEGYAIGGKTGTAEKVPRGSGKYVVSFIGFAPVEDPQVVVYVVIDELEGSQEDSGTPTRIAGEIISEILPYLQIFPENGTEIKTNQSAWGPVNSEADPDSDLNSDTETIDPDEDPYAALMEYQSQWIDEDSDGYDDLTGEYYWDDLAEYMESNGLSNE